MIINKTTILKPSLNYKLNNYKFLYNYQKISYLNNQFFEINKLFLKSFNKSKKVLKTKINFKNIFYMGISIFLVIILFTHIIYFFNFINLIVLIIIFLNFLFIKNYFNKLNSIKYTLSNKLLKAKIFKTKNINFLKK